MRDGIMQPDGTCDNNYCEDNSQSTTGQYCKMFPNGCQRGVGICMALPEVDPNSIGEWVKSAGFMNWWNANHFCEALRLRLVSRLEVCGPTFNLIGSENAPMKIALQEKFGDIWVWTRELHDECGAYFIALNRRISIYFPQYDYLHYAICH